MDLIDHLNQIAARIPGQMEHLRTEEGTKNALVLPVINALGYNVFDPTEVVPEFTADVGTKKGEKVDYVIMRDGDPTILIECKTAGAALCLNHAGQLFRYFSVTEARFAILTNGVDYQFYTDIEKPNKMDEKPFFEFSMLSLDSRAVEEIKKFSKTTFDLANILSTASELKYRKQIQAAMAAELESPSDEFIRHFAKRVYSGVITAAVRDQFGALVTDAFREFVRELVTQRIQNALDGKPSVKVGVEAPIPESNVEEESEIVTTAEEMEGFQIVRAILSKHVDPSRVVMRDTKSYCGVLLDDNNRKPICRLRFNYSQKYLGIVAADKSEDRFPLKDPVDLFGYEPQLIDVLRRYEGRDLLERDTSSQAPSDAISGK